MSGFWIGQFNYDDSWLGDPVSFFAVLADKNGALSGTISEPNTVGTSSPELNAFVNGGRRGRSVSFAKTYDGASDAAHRVDYEGTLSSDGGQVDGWWSLEDLAGAFRMTREIVEEEVIDVDAEVELSTDMAKGIEGRVCRLADQFSKGDEHG
ncbi:hypothetical protein HFP51_06470 [Parasphingopyxis sp. CP4]|uniref:hypothetical protein n=1 Tax=Parasphingopyxis sp. CP4 TaxID=2724527 RepID=UPI0015A26597|nr:hypothetical protein [Parasphingopyxis sp. CP4]QLC21853.1 hypothetical protein HFP51_06470 [Parasphingopyxis sp. CP4]